MHEVLPEYLNVAVLIPDETFVLVGYCTSEERFRRYQDHNKYIFHMDGETGSLELNSEVVSAKYLLLRRRGHTYASDLFEIISKGPKVFSRHHLKELNYRASKSPKDQYLVIKIRQVPDSEFENVRWDFKRLEAHQKIQREEPNPYSKAGLPFTVSLTELMRTKTKL